MCLYPISIKTVDSYGLPINQDVPCGKCLECLKDRQNSWKIRIQEESRDHLYCYFFTLTYNDSSVPYVHHDGRKINVVCKSDIQNWIKRNRISYQRYFKRDIDLKYFICSEYGPNTLRPHYHGVIFTDISPTFIASMFSDWRNKFGFVNFSEVGRSGKSKTKSRISSVGNYVAKYCCKPQIFKSSLELDFELLISSGVVPKPFYLISKGIGKSYIRRMYRFHRPNIRSPAVRISTICDRSFYYDQSFRYKLPRYYRDRLYRMKFPYYQNVWNNKKRVYENKIVYRYASKNILSRQMQVEIRNRLFAEYDRRVAELRASNPSLSRSEIDLQIVRSDSFFKMDRQKVVYSKMSRFYNYSRFKSRSF